ncbi:MAG: hypothetical protein BWZ10_03465 [candidate division BRC1 bacterium ADurb.BinA364]|nr:MAG: hypothetical protein BWZ10_03465 [candidate division BRC1 bacterium ADurb.BinA364]
MQNLRHRRSRRLASGIFDSSRSRARSLRRRLRAAQPHGLQRDLRQHRRGDVGLANGPPERRIQIRRSDGDRALQRRPVADVDRRNQVLLHQSAGPPRRTHAHAFQRFARALAHLYLLLLSASGFAHAGQHARMGLQRRRRRGLGQSVRLQRIRSGSRGRPRASGADDELPLGRASRLRNRSGAESGIRAVDSRAWMGRIGRVARQWRACRRPARPLCGNPPGLAFRRPRRARSADDAAVARGQSRSGKRAQPDRRPPRPGRLLPGIGRPSRGRLGR